MGLTDRFPLTLLASEFEAQLHCYSTVTCGQFELFTGVRMLLSSAGWNGIEL